MPLMIVNEDDWEKEIKNNVEIIDQKVGRGHAKEVPNELRKIIGETPDRQESLELAKAFGISDRAVGAYRHGSTSPNSLPTFHNHILNKRSRLVNKAQSKLSKALNEITEEKLREANAITNSIIAKNMSAIIKELEPEPESENKKNNAPIFQIFCPPTKSEDYFETIVVKE